MAEMGSLKWELSHVFNLQSGGPRVHRIDARDSSRRRSDTPDADTRLVIKTKWSLIVSHGGN